MTIPHVHAVNDTSMFLKFEIWMFLLFYKILLQTEKTKKNILMWQIFISVSEWNLTVYSSPSWWRACILQSSWIHQLLQGGCTGRFWRKSSPPSKTIKQSYLTHLNLSCAWHSSAPACFYLQKYINYHLEREKDSW